MPCCAAGWQARNAQSSKYLAGLHQQKVGKATHNLSPSKRFADTCYIGCNSLYYSGSFYLPQLQLKIFLLQYIAQHFPILSYTCSVACYKPSFNDKNDRTAKFHMPHLLAGNRQLTVADKERVVLHLLASARNVFMNAG